MSHHLARKTLRKNTNYVLKKKGNIYIFRLLFFIRFGFQDEALILNKPVIDTKIVT